MNNNTEENVYLPQLDKIEKVFVHPSQVHEQQTSESYTGNLQNNSDLKVNEIIEVSNGDRVFAGVITAIVNETQCQVKYFEFPDEVLLPLQGLVRMSPAAFSPEDVHDGFKCQCKYAADQKWYDAFVTSTTAHGYMVTYSEYGNSEEVPLAYLRPADSFIKKSHVNLNLVNSSETIGGNNKGNGSKQQIGTIIPIPDHLRILPTDTDKAIQIIISINLTFFLLILYLLIRRKKRNAKN